MNIPLTSKTARSLLEAEFDRLKIPFERFEVRSYPEETIFIIFVDPSTFDSAVQMGSSLDQLLIERGFSGFVTIRKTERTQTSANANDRARGVSNVKAADLANLLSARSRTSEIQPSLDYVRDAANHLQVILTARNHLIFGRRGAGKTTLMVEAKRLLQEQKHAIVWVNMQTYRHLAPESTFLWILNSLVESLQTYFGDRVPKILAELSSLKATIDILLAKEKVRAPEVARLFPVGQSLVRRFLSAAGCRLYFFLDDLHYINKKDQPFILDMVHAITRDLDAWIKVACIKHLSRWFEHSPPTGLQTGHDADHIELDLTLESPTEAKGFLDKVLNVYASHVGLSSAKSVFSDEALNRLVLASGAVPRDYLVLAASTIRSAKRRQNARQAGVQDVNRAAGEQSKVKIAELEDDAASDTNGGAQAIVRALARVRAFCIDEKRFTFFKVDFRDKEKHQRQYGLVQSLLDVRIIHLIASSLSDKREAGRRAEVFMLDLSQFSGQRLKKRIHVLDFVDSHIVLKVTSSQTADQRGDTPSKLLELLRRGPVFDLSLIE